MKQKAPTGVLFVLLCAANVSRVWPFWAVRDFESHCVSDVEFTELYTLQLICVKEEIFGLSLLRNEPEVAVG